MKNDYTNLEVCMEHFTLVGTYVERHHVCGCIPVEEGWREREWAGYDIAALVDLCHLCARDVISSGTRWSWYACATCRQVNNETANAITRRDDRRAQLIPLGRHSLMNGVTLGAPDLEDDVALTQFANSMARLVGVANRLGEWRTEEGTRLATAGEFSGHRSVPLEEWLESSPSSYAASADAVSRFLGFEPPSRTIGLGR